MKLESYPCPLSGGGTAAELALTFAADRKRRVLVIPALFDEASKLRRFTVEVMRRLDGAGIDCFLPDLPGCNESALDLTPLEAEDWATAIHAAARHFDATAVLAIRGGALLIPPALPGWTYAPVKGANLLKTMLRARIFAAREAGREEKLDRLMAQGLERGLNLAGYPLSREMLRQLDAMIPVQRNGIAIIDQEALGGSPLWLRAEPGENAAQADALAAIIAMKIGA